MTIIAVLLALVLGGLLALTPRISRPTVPLGVSVPSERRDDPAVRSATRRYLAGVGTATALGIAAALVPALGNWAMGVSALVVVIGSLVAYVVARRGIVAAKDVGQWYADVPVRLVAQLESSDRPTVRWTWFSVALALNLAVIGYGVASYGSLPARIPTHSGFDGTPDTWGEKSCLNVLGPALVALSVTLVTALCAAGIARSPERVGPDGDLAAARRRARITREAAIWSLALTALIVALALATVNVMSWRGVTGWPVSVAMGALVLGPILFSGAAMVRVARLPRPQPSVSSGAQVAGGRHADSPDDDMYWKWGLFYSNPYDPATLVPKRTGVGVTVNFATPGGKAFYGFVAVVTLVPLLIGLVAQL